MKIWHWGPTTIWHNIECVAFFQNHPTLLYGSLTSRGVIVQYSLFLTVKWRVRTNFRTLRARRREVNISEQYKPTYCAVHNTHAYSISLPTVRYTCVFSSYFFFIHSNHFNVLKTSFYKKDCSKKEKKITMLLVTYSMYCTVNEFS